VVALVMLGYGLVVAAIGVWAARRTRTGRDFFAASRRLGVWTMSIAAMAATTSGFAFIGGPGLVYSIGLGAVFIVLPLAITTTLTGWVLARPLRQLAEEHEVFTIPGAIGVRYRSPVAQGLAAVAIVAAVIGYLATNFLALGIVLDAVFHTGLGAGIWLGAVLTVAYSVGGGMLAGVYADLFQGVVMAVASTAVFLVALSTGGGLSSMSREIAAADPVFMSPWGRLSPLAALSFYFVFGVGALGQPHVLHKFFMLRDPRQLRWYPAIMTVAMTLSLLLFVGVGLAVKTLVVRGALPPLSRPDDATPRFLLTQASPLLAGLVFAGVAAAIMSTVNSFLSIAAACVTHDLPAAFGRTVRDPLRRGRLSTLAIAAAGVAVALTSNALVAFLGLFGWGLFASALVPVLAIGLHWPRATRSGAIASIVTGLVVTLTLESASYARWFTFPAGVNASAVALVSSLAVFLAVSSLDRRAGR
jgi:Na+/proline symporter